MTDAAEPRLGATPTTISNPEVGDISLVGQPDLAKKDVILGAGTESVPFLLSAFRRQPKYLVDAVVRIPQEYLEAYKRTVIAECRGGSPLAGYWPELEPEERAEMVALTGRLLSTYVAPIQLDAALGPTGIFDRHTLAGLNAGYGAVRARLAARPFGPPKKADADEKAAWENAERAYIEFRGKTEGLTSYVRIEYSLGRFNDLYRRVICPEITPDLPTPRESLLDDDKKYFDYANRVVHLIGDPLVRTAFTKYDLQYVTDIGRVGKIISGHASVRGVRYSESTSKSN